MDKFFFDSWESIIRSFVITILAYFSLIILLRISGKRTLSKMNAFDFIITIAFGSSLATVALNKQVTLADGALVFALLILLQYCITWTSVRIPKMKKLITSQPTLLFYKGEFLNEAIKNERITQEELFLAAREKGVTEMQKIDAIVLETNGELTVIPKISETNADALQDVEHFKKVKTQ